MYATTKNTPTKTIISSLLPGIELVTLLIAFIVTNIAASGLYFV